MTDPNITSESVGAKREAALQKLRKRRGESREPIFESRQERELTRVQPLIKAYKTQKATWNIETQAVTETTETLEAAVEASPTPAPEAVVVEAPPGDEVRKLARAKQTLDRRDETAQAAVSKWRSLMQSRRQRQSTVSEVEPPPITMPETERKQMFSDLLTVDFMEHTRNWLSSAPGDSDLSTSSLDEVEAIYKQAQYRKKVIDLLQEMNERELDAMDLYLHVARQALRPKA